jgi:hypothetical protein
MARCTYMVSNSDVTDASMGSWPSKGEPDACTSMPRRVGKNWARSRRLGAPRKPSRWQSTIFVDGGVLVTARWAMSKAVSPVPRIMMVLLGESGAVAGANWADDLKSAECITETAGRPARPGMVGMLGTLCRPVHTATASQAQVERVPSGER